MEQFFSVSRTPLAKNWSLRRSDYDVVVVGSGYGGSIAAARLATAEWPPNAEPTICLLERGKEWLPGQFPDTFNEGLNTIYHHRTNPLGLYKFEASPDIAVFQGSGLGGTSLLNANVAYTPEPEAFDDPRWPQAIRDARDGGELDALFDRVRFTLAAEQHPEGDSLSKVKALKKGAPTDGSSPHFVNRIVVNFEPDGRNRWDVPQRKCLNCGDCVTGCNPGAKNTLDTNYLAIARFGGADIFPQVEVRHVAIDPAGGYLVHYVRHITANSREEGVIKANRAVIVSAGSLGSAEIMLRSRDQGLPLPDTLGRCFSGNGDFFGMAYNGNERTDVLGWGAFPLSDRARRIQPVTNPPPLPQEMLHPGPAIVSTIRYNRNGPFAQRFNVQDTSLPLMYVDIIRAALVLAIGRDTDTGDEFQEFGRRMRDFAALDPELQKGALNHTMMYLVMGRDDASGEIRLDGDGNARIRWPDAGHQPIFQVFNNALKEHTAKLGATFLDHPLWGFSPWRTLVTVHPLGGCPMGETAATGLVDDMGQVFNGQGSLHPGLYVTDGSIFPASIGVNPFLTISGLSERIAEGVIRSLGGNPRVLQQIPPP